jgi:hypothetical protein
MFSGVHDVFVTKIESSGNSIGYSTYLGGTDKDLGYDIDTNNYGKTSVTGLTFSTDFPLNDPLISTNGGYEDVFLTIFNRAGNILVFSSYLGGVLGDVGYGNYVDWSGNTYVTGITASVNFPTVNAFKKEIVKDSAFITKLVTPLEFDLCTGLNLISLPYQHSDLSKSAVLLDSICDGEAEAIWKYDCTNNAFISWTQLDSGRGFKSKPGLPLWVNIASPSACTWRPEGTVYENIRFELCRGLNLVSVPVYSKSLEKASDLLLHIADCNAVWRLQTDSNCSSDLEFVAYYDISSPSDDFYLGPGQPYWVNVLAPGEWIPPNP